MSDLFHKFHVTRTPETKEIKLSSHDLCISNNAMTNRHHYNVI